MRWLIRLTRAVLLVAACGLIAVSHQRTVATPIDGDVAFEDAARLFPSAARFGARDPATRGQIVLDAGGRPLGVVLQTSPQTDHLVGYAGPSNVLIGLDPEGDIAGAQLVWSRDTTEHVDQVRANEDFWNQFRTWNPALGETRRIEGVSGSTLTSLAMAESIDARLGGHSGSLRFPDPISVAEVQSIFPTAAVLVPNVPRKGWMEVRDQSERPVGFVLRTSPLAENVRGYSGPTEALVAVDLSQRKVIAVRLRKSYDTAEYVERVRDDRGYLDSLAGRTINEWSRLDFATAGIEGVSGATQTSYGLAEGIRRRLKADVEEKPVSLSGWKTRDLGLMAIVLGGLIVTFVPEAGGRPLRIAWQIVLVAAFGLWLGDLLSVSLVAGWSRHGPPWATAPGLVALAAVALVAPWTTRRQVYCHALCPHGAVQEWLGRFKRLHVRLPRSLSRVMGLLPGLLLVTSFAVALARPAFNLSQIEPFDAWVLGPLAAASFVIAIIGVVASLFVPQAYCRFGCPTGALLKLIRSHGRADRWRPHDVAAAVAVLIAALWLYWPTSAAPVQAVRGPLLAEFSGRAFGTTWSVKVRDPLPRSAGTQEQIAAELEKIEAKLSHWRPDSETSQFNASQTTLEIECSKDLASLVKQAQELSRETDGAFDITVGPLVDAWGYGPSGPKGSPPSDEQIRALLASMGWKKIEVDESVPSLRKTDPAVQIDLGALLQGFAVDRIHELLERHGLRDFLVEIGGELRSSGRWNVALDSDAGRWAAPSFTLMNQAVSTSGIYRRGSGGATRHIISPLTGRPVEAPWKAVAVVAPTCREADGWDTALFVARDAVSIVNDRKLTVQLIPSDDGVTVLSGPWNRIDSP
ncbi:MAG TPA: FAD:protein FMN transferase [Caulifigura sp.]|nr:FAD:protein FMN transferase [Caulifigura sp.]